MCAPCVRGVACRCSAGGMWRASMLPRQLTREPDCRDCFRRLLKSQKQHPGPLSPEQGANGPRRWCSASTDAGEGGFDRLATKFAAAMARWFVSSIDRKQNLVRSRGSWAVWHTAGQNLVSFAAKAIFRCGCAALRLTDQNGKNHRRSDHLLPVFKLSFSSVDYA